MKANDVIKMGRSRSLAASWVASRTGIPASCFSRANSTIKIAFLHARPTRTTSPTWTKMFTDVPEARTPTTAHSTHSGTTRITARGSVQLS